ncbi:MAG: hypothetical protein IPI35_10425 [Deltaproteobacteria bacterium]|nr:hypothetical protein [Deltaproteobacteria bacterium]
MTTALTDDLPVPDALNRYFQESGFAPDGGYSDDWVKFMLGPIPFWLPNTSARVYAVRYHDLNHIATGYPSTHWRGEFQISAWEIGSGCGDAHAAWFINLAGMFTGLLLMPLDTFDAFVRGRRSRRLYNQDYNQLLTLRVGELRQKVGADERQGPATAEERRAFVGWSAAAAAVGMIWLVAYLTPPALVIWGLWSLLS